MPERLARHLLRALAGKKHIGRHAVQQPGAPVFKVILNPQHRLFTQRYQTFFISFTNHAQHALSQANVAHGQAHQLGNAQTGGVQHFQHRFIAQLQRLFNQRRLEQAFHLRLAQILRQPLRQLWRGQQRAGIVRANFLPVKMLEETAHGA